MIVWVHEALASGSGVAEHDSGNSYSRVFDVLTDTYDDNAATVANATDPSSGLSIPAPYSYFSKGNDADYNSIVTRIVPDRDTRMPLLWHVRVEYTVLRANTSDGQWPAGTITFDTTPTLPAIRTWPIAVLEAVNQDINGKLITNSAGQKVTPTPEDVRYLTAIEIQWRIRTYNFDDWEPFADSTNAAPVWGRDPGTLLMIGLPSATRKVDQIGTYWEIRCEFHWDKRGWGIKVEDNGKRRLATDSGAPPSASEPATGLVDILDNHGKPIEEDWPLDGKGQPLELGKSVVWLDYVVKEPRDWTPLNLPTLNITWGTPA